MEATVFNTIMKNLNDMTTKCQEIKAVAVGNVFLYARL